MTDTHNSSLREGHRSAKAILFDLDETLTVHEQAFAEAYVATAGLAAERRAIDAAQLAASVPMLAESICQVSPAGRYAAVIGIGGRDLLWSDPDGDRPELQRMAEWVEGFRAEVWEAVLSAHGIPDSKLAQELAERFPDEMRARIKVYPEARGVLDDVKDDYEMAVVTNGLPLAQHEKLQIAGLDSYFETVVVSGELGAGKPSALMFEEALKRLGCQPEDAVMVGDNPARDILGANKAGIRAVWVNRFNLEMPGSLPAPDAEIADLSQLKALL
ncbi:MAG: HAD family hydrolase [Dehalococcoidia bacterium]